MRLAIALVACTGCASLIGIDDSHPLTCQSLSVTDDHGAAAVLSPAFASDHNDYTAQVAPGASSVRVAVACDDPDAIIEVEGTRLDGQSVPLPVPVVVHVVVRAGTADPAPELDYTVTVGVAM
jgi:hypothetical protein